MRATIKPRPRAGASCSEEEEEGSFALSSPVSSRPLSKPPSPSRAPPRLQLGGGGGGGARRGLLVDGPGLAASLGDLFDGGGDGGLAEDEDDGALPNRARQGAFALKRCQVHRR